MSSLHVLTFAGAVGDQVLVRMRSLSGSIEAFVRVLRPDGTELCRGFRNSGDSRALELPPCVVDQAGAHFILVADLGSDEAGDYQLLLQRFNMPGNLTPITFGQTLSDTISPPIDLDAFSFGGTVGDQVQITMTRTSWGVDPHIRTFKADGTVVTSCTGSTTSTQLQVTCTLDATEDHAILVGDSGADETGNYDLSLVGPRIPVCILQKEKEEDTFSQLTLSSRT